MMTDDNVIDFDRILSFTEFLLQNGIVQTNTNRLHKGLTELHYALSCMDIAQLRQLKTLPVGKQIADVCDAFGYLEEGLRHDFNS